MSLALRTLLPKHAAAPFLQPKHAPVLSFRRRRSGPGPYANQIFHTGADDNLRHLTAQFGAVAHTFGYGSGVFPQAGYGAAAVPKPQIDMVHIVADPAAFHRANSARFPAHYSALLLLGVGAVAWVQRLGAGVYFNPYVAMAGLLGEKSMVKYGVVSQQTALDDITQWTTMYVAGRLHKPVKHFGVCSPESGPDSAKSPGPDSTDLPALFLARLLHANNYNLASAFNLSLLLLPRKKRHTAFAEDALYEKIALLSYMGDPRMLVGGENPNKVKNIVSKQALRFALLYEPYLAQALRNGLLQRAPDGQLENHGRRSGRGLDCRLALVFPPPRASVVPQQVCLHAQGRSGRKRLSCGADRHCACGAVSFGGGGRLFFAGHVESVCAGHHSIPGARAVGQGYLHGGHSQVGEVCVGKEDEEPTE